MAFVEGTDTDDTLDGTTSGDVIRGGLGDDVIYGKGGPDKISGGAGNDTIYISYDLLYALGGGGNDRFVAEGLALNSTYQARVTGGAGRDEFDATRISAGANYLFFTDTGARNTFQVGSYIVDEVEIVRGGSGPNWFLLQKFDYGVTAYGANYNDVFYLSPGGGNVSYGYGGDDTFTVWNRDKAYGGTGNDQFNIALGGGTGTLVDGGEGVDSITFSFGTVDLDRGLAFRPWGEPVRLIDIENVTAHRGSRLLGNDADNILTTPYGSIDQGSHLDGRGGDDTLIGSDLGDTLIGGAGNDTLIGGAGGYDIMDGGTGADTVVFMEGTQVIATLTDTGSSKFTIDGVDRGEMKNIENLTGGGFNDILTGNSKANRLEGGSGDDVMDGGRGNDTLVDGFGYDIMTGGEGSDRFMFTDNGALVGEPITVEITDFEQGLDRIILTAIDANTLVEGNQAFRFIGEEAFHGRAGELRFVRADAITLIYGDLNGDRVDDFNIQLDGVINLVASDFSL
ncbi:hypothetical protein F1C10_11575 [Sphingomonas sp. NBWT7]|uniref:calcium-binding protein n=1 Tax=Sphingomonas sp. NBWT7 TaxID=2596913 RepID=UPI00162AB024|nr:M10 family metallopeptidase C-terminal domain-containing protein [Sphingomonas sp. NBWT7]QNE32523.1 hypothetical protein F1C10_11575 [Sphingomonas sp. NBWT7]